MTEKAGFPVATRRGLTEDVHRFTHQAMATTFEVIIPGPDRRYARQAAGAAFEVLDSLEGELSRFEGGSDVWQINHLPARGAIRVGPATLECLLAARQVFQDTGGAFDVTAGALVNCWRSDDGRALHPSVEQIAATQAVTGMDLLIIDAEQKAVGVLAEGVCVDLGGIGKGYALDRMAEILADWDIAAAFLSGGTSTVKAIGPAEEDDGWRLAVRDPEKGPDVEDALYLRSRSFSGSGTALKGGHIIDPRTGEPAGEQRSNAWAAANSATLADALSTAFMVMTVAEVDGYCRRHPDVGAMLPATEGGRLRLLRFGRWE